MAISKTLRFAVFERDHFACAYCKRDDLPLEVDHVIPRALGGQDVLGNLRAACRDCNRGKGSTPITPPPTIGELRQQMKDLRPTKRQQLEERWRPDVAVEERVVQHSRVIGAHVGRGGTVDEIVDKLRVKFPREANSISAAIERHQRRQVVKGLQKAI